MHADELTRTSSASPAGGCPTCSGRACASRDVLDRAGVQADGDAPCGSSASTARTPRASRSTQARRDDVIVAYQLEGEPTLRGARWAGPALRRADVRLQVDQVARRHRADRQGRARATGSSAATTSTGGSGGRMAATTSRPDRDVGAVADHRRRERARDLVRFDRVERIVHWVTAALFVIADAHRRGALRRAAISTSSATARSCARSTSPPGSRSRSRSWSGSSGDGGGRCAATSAASTAGRGDDRALAPAADARQRAARQVQPGPEAQRDVPRRGGRADARDRLDHEVVRAVPARRADRRDVRARLVRARRLARRRRPHPRSRSATPTRSGRCWRGTDQRALGARASARAGTRKRPDCPRSG